MKKIIYAVILLITTIFVTGCNYKPSWDTSFLKYYGQTEDYIITKDSNEKYHISEINRKVYGKDEFVVPKSVIINDEEIYIDYVDDIFSGYRSLRKITIEFTNHNLKLTNCYRLRIIEIDEKDIIDPSSFLSDVSGKFIYITNATRDYSIYTFYNNNTVKYQKSPISTFTENFISNTEKQIINMIIINLLIGVVSGILLLIYHKVYEPFHIFSKSSAILLFILPFITAILGIVFIHNLLWIYGIFLVVPFIIAINAILILDDSNLFKVFMILLGFASTFISYFMILPNVLPNQLTDVYLTTFIFLLLLIFIQYIMNFTEITTIIGLIITTPIITICIKLLDNMYYYGFKEFVTSILCIGVQALAYFGIVIGLCIFVMAIIALFKDYTISSYTPTYINVAPTPSPTPRPQPQQPQPIPEISVRLIRQYADKLPDGCYWESRPTITIRNGNVTISGTIHIEDSPSKDVYNERIRYCDSKLKEKVRKAFNIYYRETPNGYNYNLNYEVSYRGSYWD